MVVLLAEDLDDGGDVVENHSHGVARTIVVHRIGIVVARLRAEDGANLSEKRAVRQENLDSYRFFTLLELPYKSRSELLCKHPKHSGLRLDDTRHEAGARAANAPADVVVIGVVVIIVVVGTEIIIAIVVVPIHRIVVIIVVVVDVVGVVRQVLERKVEQTTEMALEAPWAADLVVSGGTVAKSLSEVQLE